MPLDEWLGVRKGGESERAWVAVTAAASHWKYTFFANASAVAAAAKAHVHEQWIKCLICISVLLLQRLVFEINRTVCECACARLRDLYYTLLHVWCSYGSNLMLFNTCTLCLFGNYFDFEFILRLCVHAMSLTARTHSVCSCMAAKCEVLRKFHVVFENDRIENRIFSLFPNLCWRESETGKAISN